MKKLDPSIFKLKIYFVLNLKFYILIKPCLDERARCLIIVVFIKGQTKWRKSRAKRYKWRQIGNCGNTRHPHPRPQHSIVTLVTISFNALCHLINLWSTLRYIYLHSLMMSLLLRRHEGLHSLLAAIQWHGL